MKAELKAKIDNSKRVPLQDVLPLETPFSVQIDIASACNLRCLFCFHCDAEAIVKENVHFTIMKFSVFKKIIDDMKTDWSAKVKKLRLFAHGEPLLNKDIISMSKYAKKMQVAEIIEVTTNGTLIDDDFISNVKDSGIDIINISVNGINEKQYLQQCDYKMDYDIYLENIRKLFENKGDCKLYVKLSDIGYSKEDIEAFLSKFGDICDQIFIEGVSDALWIGTNIKGTFKSNTEGIYGKEYEKKLVCTTIFTTMVITSNGDVILCCQDWKGSHVVGNVNQDSVGNIWRGSRMREYQMAQLQGKRSTMELCRECISPEITTPDNIDKYADEILTRLQSL